MPVLVADDQLWDLGIPNWFAVLAIVMCTSQLASRGFERANISNDAWQRSFPQPIPRLARSFSNTHGAVYSTTAWSSWWLRPKGLLWLARGMDHIWARIIPQQGLDVTVAGWVPAFRTGYLHPNIRNSSLKNTWSNRKLSHENGLVWK